MLKDLRLSAGLSQSQLSSLSGVNIRTLQNYEQGEKDFAKANATIVYNLSKSLNCTMEQLVEPYIPDH